MKNGPCHLVHTESPSLPSMGFRERREVKDVVKIESGKNTAIEVRIRKGRPTFKIGRN